MLFFLTASECAISQNEDKLVWQIYFAKLYRREQHVSDFKECQCSQNKNKYLGSVMMCFLCCTRWAVRSSAQIHSNTNTKKHDTKRNAKNKLKQAKLDKKCKVNNGFYRWHHSLWHKLHFKSQKCDPFFENFLLLAHSIWDKLIFL